MRPACSSTQAVRNAEGKMIQLVLCNLLVIGTTGPPKAAMLCHDNITYGAAISKVAYCWEQGR